jgi:aminopeptidase
MIIPNFKEHLNKYADTIVRVGLNLHPGQRLLINAPLLAAPLVRAVAAFAYQNGCPLVDINWRDEQMELIRCQHARRDSFTEYPIYRAEGALKHVSEGGALLSITGENPDLLKDQDPELITTARKTALKHMKPVYDLLDRNGFNWAIVSYPTDPWAEKVFPQLEPAGREARLWEVIFQVCRIHQDDPVAAWQAHIADLQTRAEYLNHRQYHALAFRAPGTDLTIGLAERHFWAGGSSTTESGIEFTPNLPTEEVFTLPHRERINGVVTASMPLSYGGNLIEGFSLTFKDGRVTELHAERGEDILRKMIETDEGMSSLGEVALVSQSSPVAKSGTLFYNTLLDENAASHIALGDGLNFCLQGGKDASEEEYITRGGNSSLNHVDFMIGSAEMDIDGILPDGTRQVVMRSGEWAFQV